MKKILVLGGEPTSLLNFRGHLIKKFLHKGFKVITSANGIDDDVRRILSQMGAEFYPASFSRNGLNPLGDFLYSIRLAKLIHKVKPDIILPYTIKPVIYGCLVAKLFGLSKIYPIITGLGHVFVNGDTLKANMLRKLVKLLYRIALNGATCVFFQNLEDEKDFRRSRIISSKTQSVRLMGSGVDLNHFQFQKLSCDKVEFLMVARLLAEKGLMEYIEASRLLGNRKDEAKFSLLGPFDTNPACVGEAELDEWSKTGVIEYLGATNDVRPFLRKCSVFILPSYREGMPRSTLEALAIGRPVITTNVPGCRDTVVDEYNGFLVPVKDPKSLARAMSWCIDNRDNLPLMGKRSRRIAEEKFNVEDINNTIFDIIAR